MRGTKTIAHAYSRLLLFTHSFFFRIAVCAHTGSLPVSSSFRVTYFRDLLCLPLSEWVASQVNSRYVITLHFLKRAWLTTSTLFVVACLHWYQNIAFKLQLSAASRTATYCILHDWDCILPGCFGSLYKLISACCCCCEMRFHNNINNNVLLYDWRVQNSCHVWLWHTYKL